MTALDWTVLLVTLAFIVLYGIWKSRNTRTMQGYLLADKQLPWYHVGLSVMATQASAITFLSAPGQGYADGLRFVQFYFGLPLAMVLLCITFVPIFHKLNVYTAYEYLEKRFDNRTRSLTAGLFLLQRGLSTGITIYAPAIILSTILHIDINFTILMNGILVIIYTVYGGTKAVSHTQLLQMAIIFSGIIIAAWLVVRMLPESVGIGEALYLAGSMEKLNAIDLNFDLQNRYNIWSGIIGGFFLQLSYFGTDQSQVGRYLTGSSVAQSRLGLIMNGIVKIPMQFFILLTGVLVFVFYQFNEPPLFFNTVETEQIARGRYGEELEELKTRHADLFLQKKTHAEAFVYAVQHGDEQRKAIERGSLQALTSEQENIRTEVKELIRRTNAVADTNDSNFVFLHFVTTELPSGIVGLLIAVIFLAAMGSTASGLNSLASTTIVDFYKRYRPQSDAKDVRTTRWLTAGWGAFCIIVAIYAGRLGNLIEAVNILGSLFYGTILGIFLVAFYLKKVQGKAVFFAALIAEGFVIAAWLAEFSAFLWLNVIGCLLVVIFSVILTGIFRMKDNRIRH